MKHVKDSPEFKANSPDRKKSETSSTSSVSRKPIFDTNYYYYYFTEVEQKK